MSSPCWRSVSRNWRKSWYGMSVSRLGLILDDRARQNIRLGTLAGFAWSCHYRATGATRVEVWEVAHDPVCMGAGALVRDAPGRMVAAGLGAAGLAGQADPRDRAVAGGIGGRRGRPADHDQA